MPRRNKKKSTKSKKRDSGISINIKNIVKQIQNERPKQKTDFISFRPNPNRNLNNGSMTRMFAPPVTYASTPLSSFPSLASLNPITTGMKQYSQLTSDSDIGQQREQPIVEPGDIVTSIRPENVTSLAVTPDLSIPTVSNLKPSKYGTNEESAPLFQMVTATGDSMTPREFVRSLEAELANESQRLVAGQMDMDARNFRKEYYPIPDAEVPEEKAVEAVAPRVEMGEFGQSPNRERGPRTGRVIIPRNPNLVSAGLARGGMARRIGC
jgi:hypothetical protein